MNDVDEYMIKILETRREAFQDIYNDINTENFKGFEAQAVQAILMGRIIALNDTIENLLVS